MALVVTVILAQLENILNAFESKYNGNINNPEFIGSVDETTYYNIWADYWRYVIGVNVIPFITRIKNAHEDLDWKVFEHSPISEEQHETWKTEKMFNDGMAIICGTVWHNPEKKGLQLNGIDADNLPAVNEICFYKGKQFSVHDLAKWTLVERHDDAPYKIHIIVYSTKPFLKKASNNNSPALKAGIKANEIPAIEVKSSDDTFLFVSGSPHKGSDTCPYKIIGTKEPALCDDFENHIDSICTKYKIPYLSADNGNGKAEIPIEELFEEDFEIFDNNNRHEALMRAMESLIKRNKQILPLEYIKETLSRDWNNKHCKPPLDDYEFDKQWKCALKFIEQKQQEEHKFTFGFKQNNKSAPAAESQRLSQEEKDTLEERIKVLVEAYHGLSIISTPEAMIERFNIKTTRPDKEIFYFDKDKGIYLPNGNIVIEECLERSSKNAGMFYTSIYEMLAKLYSDIEDTKLRDKTISERLMDEGVEPGQEWSIKEIKEFFGHVERQTYFYRDDFNSKIEWLACKDCMVNLLTGETANFSPEYLCTTQIPVKYYVPEPNVIGTNDLNRLSGCPKILKFLHDIVEPEDVETILDFFAYCLWRDYKYHN